MTDDCGGCPMRRLWCTHCLRIIEQWRRRAHAVECGDDDEVALIDAELAAFGCLPANDNSRLA